MSIFKFFQDRKYTVWERTHFIIEADTENIAISCAVQAMKDDISTVDIENAVIVIEETETLYDTMEYICVEENAGQPTQEIYMGTPRKNTLLTDNLNCKFCPRCGRTLTDSTVTGYTYQCTFCDEVFYPAEVINPHTTPPEKL